MVSERERERETAKFVAKRSPENTASYIYVGYVQYNNN